MVGVAHHAQQVVVHQHLPVAGGAGADTNGGDLECSCDGCGNVPQDALQHYGKAACLLQGTRLRENPQGLVCCLGLGPEATCRFGP